MTVSELMQSSHSRGSIEVKQKQELPSCFLSDPDGVAANTAVRKVFPEVQLTGRQEGTSSHLKSNNGYNQKPKITLSLLHLMQGHSSDAIMHNVGKFSNSYIEYLFLYCHQLPILQVVVRSSEGTFHQSPSMSP